MRKTCKRKVRDPMAWVASRRSLSESQRVDLGLQYHGAMLKMMNGYGDAEAQNTLACAVNIGLVLAEMSKNAEYEKAMIDAQLALCRTNARALKLGKYGFSGEDSVIVKNAFLLHDEQIAKHTQGRIMDALKEVRRRIDAGEVMQ